MWKITYSPGYIEEHREVAENQMRLEIADPTPLHVADLQFQALVEFDCSKALPDIRSPTLVLTGDGDQMVPPENSRIIANLITGANLTIVPSCGHRVMWEATDECVAFISKFLSNIQEGGRLVPVAASSSEKSQTSLLDLVDFVTPAVNLFTKWPWMMIGASVDIMTIARQSSYSGSATQFGDGKPINVVERCSEHLEGKAGRDAVHAFVDAGSILVFLDAAGLRIVLEAFTVIDPHFRKHRGIFVPAQARHHRAPLSPASPVRRARKQVQTPR